MRRPRTLGGVSKGGGELPMKGRLAASISVCDTGADCMLLKLEMNAAAAGPVTALRTEPPICQVPGYLGADMPDDTPYVYPLRSRRSSFRRELKLPPST